MISSSTNIQKSAICFYVAVLLFALTSAKAEQTILEDSHSYPQVIHPVTRQTAWPSDDTVVYVNPPSLLWPVVKRQDIRYRVQLSMHPYFSSNKTIKSNDLPWAIFNPHTKLAGGKWYWRYEVLRSGQVQSVSDIYSFIISNSARAFVTPAARQMLSVCPKSHPRILMTSGELTAFRKRMKNSQQAKSIVNSADKFIGREPPSEDSAIPRQKGKNAFEQKNYAKWASKALGNQLSASIGALTKAYIITGDKKYGKQAVRYAIHTAKFDPEGLTSPKVSDFADGTCLRSMVLAYDSCFDLLTAQEKIKLRNAIAVRAGRMFTGWRNNLETKVFSAHVWQHILHEFAEAAFATLSEIDEAELWASYIYELWLGRVPLLGGNDGGWANGNNYFGTNFVTLISIPTFFEQLTGVDFFSHPWYRNAIYYMIYTWPPRSAPDGFGDGCERRELSPLSRLAFADILGRKFNDSYAGWYVRESLQPLQTLLENDSSQMWHRLRAGYSSPAPTRSSFDLPQGRLFRDIGVVAMHKDITDYSNNLMLAFCSSPYGSYNHAHANQNSFNILFGGKRLYSNSGYYIGYADDHFKGWYKHSRGHNTVLIDNKGQLSGTPNGYGWIARYLHGHRITYCLGDASNAYGNTGLILFRRHVAFLRPSIVVIYDELEADHAAQWSWLLHCTNKISSDPASNCLTATVSSARSKIDFFSPIPLNFDVHNRFDPPALNWRNRTSGGKIIQYPNQWHASVSPEGKVNKMRYLVIIQVLGTKDESSFNSPKVLSDHTVQVGLWSIEVELDPSKSATLEIHSSDRKAALAVNKASINISSEKYETTRRNSSILVEKLLGHDIVIESADSGPTQ
jgi:hypothetical protein